MPCIYIKAHMSEKTYALYINGGSYPQKLSTIRRVESLKMPECEKLIHILSTILKNSAIYAEIRQNVTKHRKKLSTIPTRSAAYIYKVFG